MYPTFQKKRWLWLILLIVVMSQEFKDNPNNVLRFVIVYNFCTTMLMFMKSEEFQ